jgi:hypothetical protein
MTADKPGCAEPPANLRQKDRGAFAFKAPGTFKLNLLKYKPGEDVVLLGAEIKIAPQKIKLHVLGVDVAGQAEIKGSFSVDLKKVGAEIGKDVLKKVAKEALEKEAEREGVKLLGREAAQQVVKDLGPLAFAFGVGLKIGELLNRYTVAPEAAGYVMKDILGDLNDRFQHASTFGKMVLISKNSPRIAAAAANSPRSKAARIAAASASVTTYMAGRMGARAVGRQVTCR